MDCHPDCHLREDCNSIDIDMIDDDSNTIDMTADIQRAVNVNNGGTELLRDRRYEAAVKSFTSVLTILKPLAALVEGNIAENDDANYHNNNNNNNDDSDSSSNNNSNNNAASSMPLSMNFAASGSSTTTNNNENETTRRRRQETQRHYQESPVENGSADIDMMDAVASTTAIRRSSLSSDNNGYQSPNPAKRKKKDEGERAGSPTTSSSSSSSSTTKKLSASSSSSAAAAVEKQRGYFVFRDPVEIPIESVPQKVSIPVAPTTGPQDGSDGSASSDLFSKFIMIVMYNLALTLHLQAIEADSNDGTAAAAKSTGVENDNNSNNKGRGRGSINKRAKRLFSRARKLYELAFEMHLDESCEDVNLLFTLALINNLGLIYDRTGETSRSETCFGNMLSTMMYLTDSNESRNVKQWDGLLSNVMDILFFKQKKATYEVAAPAA